MKNLRLLTSIHFRVSFRGAVKQMKLPSKTSFIFTNTFTLYMFDEELKARLTYYKNSGMSRRIKYLC